ncbi:RNA polymerase factor sigma-54 [Chitinimonas taiwanensis]|jgi:RNA polymerase sigma-54 factor|uniref:RNA polymerase sigma-54 factor n=1 Tax=Chitinimonas taiwanensis DSM 18899 TaxID=1121279 RepID=A0A1K2HID5_9NEIS|nr:RNA polymerase factor sigma-54 [Chitinimonas taiwanensis]SFZ76026.1 RNA polymerase, sigma 54 subunit, RpoN/SigL [Chitinimonas taiwanensis DSM 18899]
MKQSLQLKLSQSLTLTPQLQQSIKLLQLSTLDLNQEIERFLQDNPMLEREDDNEPDTYLVHEDGTPTAPVEQAAAAAETPADEASQPDFDMDDSLGDNYWNEASGGSGKGNEGDDEFDAQANVARISTLREHLLEQLGLLPLSPRDHAVATLIIDALDDDGYLGMSLAEIHELIPPELREALELELDELQVAWQLVRQLEPCGVGAVDLKDCLGMQLQQLNSHEPACKLALAVVTNGLDLLANKDYSKLKRTLKCDDEALKAAQELIKRLSPRPGAAFGESDTRYVVADVIVKKLKQGWTVQLNEAAMPKLKVNQLYANILRQQRDSGAGLSGQLQEAKWLIKNVQQRFETILRVGQAIVEKQQRFFEHGEVAMRPLVLRDIAEELDLHESTISRVTTQKYMLTPRGIYEFKYFFGSHVDTDSGGECSAIAIKALIKQLIQSEDNKKPLSDSAIAEVLGKQGINVARRTVAKYREAMHIPPVNQRKSL